MKRVVQSGTRSPKKENVRKVCEAMGWNLPMFADPGVDGYICKWGGVSLVNRHGLDQVNEWISEIEQKTGIVCKLTRSGKLIIPYATV